MPITRYMSNTGGLNNTDSPLSIKDDQATGQSYNYNYARTGAITKVLASEVINSTPDAQLDGKGLGVHHDTDTDVRTVVRVAGTKVQTFDPGTETFTDQELDTTAATTDLIDSSIRQPVVMVPFNTFTGGVQLTMAGSNLDALLAYTGSKMTVNGVIAPEGEIGTDVDTSASGVWAVIGTYYYGVQFRKASTQAYSNVALDVSAVVANLDDSVTIDLTSITNIDTTLYDQIIIWRSAVSGVSGFTTGSIIAELASTETTYEDLGESLSDAENAPREFNLILDNSVLPDGTYNSVTAFKRRLVTCSGSTFYISDINKPESWPKSNVVTIPTGGPITALGIIGVPSEYTTGAEEYLCLFKENELWVLTGNDLDDWDLKFVDKTGCPSQSLVVAFNGFLSWMGYNGIFIWDGRGRPSRISRPIHALFDADGDLDKAKMYYGYSAQYAKNNLVIWRVTHKTKGINKLSIKMDTRLTALAASQNLENTELDGVFELDTDSTTLYSVASYIPSSKDEILLASDDSGYVYQMYNDASTAVAFQYETKPFDMGAPDVNKRFKRVIVYLERLVDKDLVLNYWVDYRNKSEQKSTVKVSMAPNRGSQPALWDVAIWDTASWDDYTPDIGLLSYNLHSEENNAEGVSLKLQFEQLEANAPVRIHGFSIEWDEIGPISIPTGQLN